MEIVSRRSNPAVAGRMLTCQLSDVVTGPKQLLREATSPSCDERQSWIRPGPVVNSVRIADATAGSVSGFDGLKMNARSFRDEPSPFTSPFTIGENGAPELNCAIAVISISGVTGYVSVPTN